MTTTTTGKGIILNFGSKQDNGYFFSEYAMKTFGYKGSEHLGFI